MSNLKHEVLIQLIHKPYRKCFNLSKSKPVQNSPYIYGLKIKNMGENTSPKGRITDLKLAAGNLRQSFSESMSFSELNPGKEEVLWWPKPSTLLTKGEVSVICNVIPDNIASNSFITSQYDVYTKQTNKCKGSNCWNDVFLVRTVFEHQQMKTNRLISILTILIFLQGIWEVIKYYR